MTITGDSTVTVSFQSLVNATKSNNPLAKYKSSNSTGGNNESIQNP
ncbi:hypothetical protein [Clostridium perfringens]|nr:hypothetical protein [Clostridium perfringens]